MKFENEELTLNVVMMGFDLLFSEKAFCCDGLHKYGCGLASVGNEVLGTSLILDVSNSSSNAILEPIIFGEGRVNLEIRG